jgi:hypothetical protein
MEVDEASYKSAQLLRVKKSPFRAASAETNVRQTPKSKETG